MIAKAPCVTVSSLVSLSSALCHWQVKSIKSMNPNIKTLQISSVEPLQLFLSAKCLFSVRLYSSSAPLCHRQTGRQTAGCDDRCQSEGQSRCELNGPSVPLTSLSLIEQTRDQTSAQLLIQLHNFNNLLLWFCLKVALTFESHMNILKLYSNRSSKCEHWTMLCTALEQ